MKKVLLLYGGNSSEHDVSIMSANSIINNIVGGAMCGVAFIGANIYMQKHNVS